MKRQVVPLALAVLAAACGGDSVPAEPQTPVERGLALANANACIACHTLNGTRGVGPSWLGIYGTTRTLQDGRSVVVDDAYLRRAIREPGVELVEGFDNVMVTASVSDAEIADIIALIRELQDGSPP